MSEELEVMETRAVWEEVKRPKDTRSFGTKWVYTTKKDDKGQIKRFKARLVAQGQHQVKNFDYEETYSPVINFQVIRLLFMLLVVFLGWQTQQIDIKCAYLYGKMEELVYIRIPKGYLPKSPDTTHLKLNRGLYGLHQSGRIWYQELHTSLCTAGFHVFKSTHCVYAWKGLAVILLYVDDMVLIAKTTEELKKVLKMLEEIYDVKRLGRVHDFLGVRCEQRGADFTMSQSTYIERVAERYGEFLEKRAYTPLHPGGVPSAINCPDKEERALDKPYRELLGCLLFVAQRTRPDVAFSVSLLGQYSSNPGKKHWDGLQQVMRYLYHTSKQAITYRRLGGHTRMAVYVDSDWAGSTDDRRSTSGYVIYLMGQIISWRAIKQKCIALSSMEAEYIALSEAMKEVVWMQRIIKECSQFGLTMGTPIVYCDSKAALTYAKNDIENQRNRHIDLRYHYVKDLVQRGEIELVHVSSKDNVADILTKPLARTRFEELRTALLCIAGE